jgi:hypothetical protein
LWLVVVVVVVVAVGCCWLLLVAVGCFVSPVARGAMEMVISPRTEWEGARMTCQNTAQVLELILGE